MNLIDADDIDQVVEAMQRHLEEGTVGFHGLASAHQLQYREMFHAVCLLSADWNNATFDEYHTRSLRNLLNEVTNNDLPVSYVLRVNTTLPGREQEIINGRTS